MKPCFVLVTRDRAELAMTAIRSLLAQEECTFDLVVSDNSSSAEGAFGLAEFCRSVGSSNGAARVFYIRPSQPLPMPKHWDWALEQAMLLSDATHFGVQYDRKLWIEGELRVLCDACAVDPEVVVAYGCDVVFQRAPDVVEAWAAPVTGKLYEIRTAKVIDLTSRGMVQQLGSSYPLLANCLVPRAVLAQVRERFGTICDSATPDAGFTYRFCAQNERYRYLDRASVLTHSYRLSNGFSYVRGESGGTYGDYRKLWGDRPWLEAAPIPGLDLGWNIVFHEYTLVQRVFGEKQFPSIDRDGYLRELASGLVWITDPARQNEMRRVLREHGWREDPRSPLRRLLSRVRSAMRRTPPPPPQQAPSLPTFSSEDEAIRYLVERPTFADENLQLAPLDPIEVPFRA
jgi:hypothetical protein